jgi:hypothetical protein
VQWFSDGLAVTSATEPYRDALGLRVLSIGALPPERLEAAIAPYLSYEIDGWLHQQSQTFMLVEEMLRAAGHVQPDGHVSVALEGSDGSQRLLALKPVPWRDPAPRISASDARQIPIGVARKDPVRFYRYEILPESRTVYVRYTRCANDPQQPFDTFAHELFAAVDASPQAIDRAVIDLRGNAGGDSRIIKPLLDGLRARKALSTRGRLYALVSPGTFSSGLMAAFSLKEDLGAILVGEPPGEKPNSYGEVRQLTLPNSGLVVQYSTKYFTLIKNGDPLRLEPDLVVRRSIAHFLAGRDPVLEAALARPEPLHQGPLAP